MGDAADAGWCRQCLDIPLYVLNFRKDFRRVIDATWTSTPAGAQPVCPLQRLAQVRQAPRACRQIARTTSRRVTTPGSLARGWPALLTVGTREDQSYVLFGIPRDRLDDAAADRGVRDEGRSPRRRGSSGPVFNKPDSQEICFVPDNDYASFVERELPELASARGEIRDTSGQPLGEHEGHRFTIGQRRKIGGARASDLRGRQGPGDEHGHDR